MGEVQSERGVGVVNECVFELDGRLANFWLQFAAVVRIMTGDKSLPAPEQPQLGVRIEAAVAHPSAQKQILARKFVAVGGVRARQWRYGSLQPGRDSPPHPHRAAAPNPWCTARSHTASAPRSRAMVRPRLGLDIPVRSRRCGLVEPESTSTISSAQRTLAKVRPMFASSSIATIATEIVIGELLIANC